MKKYVALLALVFFLGLGWAAAQETWKPQTSCPVSGKPINKEVFLDFQGQRIYFCCPSCPAEFQKDPEEYFAKFEKEHIELENIQTSCPVSGEELGENPVVIHFKGRTVKFCCPSCEKPFRANPEKYLAALPGGEAKQSSRS